MENGHHEINKKNAANCAYHIWSRCAGPVISHCHVLCRVGHSPVQKADSAEHFCCVNKGKGETNEWKKTFPGNFFSRLVFPCVYYITSRYTSSSLVCFFAGGGQREFCRWKNNRDKNKLTTQEIILLWKETHLNSQSTLSRPRKQLSCETTKTARIINAGREEESLYCTKKKFCLAPTKNKAYRMPTVISFSLKKIFVSKCVHPKNKGAVLTQR